VPCCSVGGLSGVDIVWLSCQIYKMECCARRVRLLAYVLSTPGGVGTTALGGASAWRSIAARVRAAGSRPAGRAPYVGPETTRE